MDDTTISLFSLGVSALGVLVTGIIISGGRNNWKTNLAFLID